MPSEKIEITSNALIRIGDDPISQWNETQGGVVSEEFYDRHKKEMLMDYPWTFATKYKQLTLESFTPPDELNYNYAHKLPNDSLRLWSIYPQRTDYNIWTNIIYSNQESLYAVYVYNADESELSEKFKIALEFFLATSLSISITEDTQTYDRMKEGYSLKSKEARHIDSTQKPVQQIVHAPFLEAHSGFLSDNYRQR